MEEKLQKKIGDWAAFLAAVFVVLANPLGILGVGQRGYKAALNTTKRWGWKLRKFVGKHLAWPVVMFYVITVVVVDLLAHFVCRAVGTSTDWTRQFVTWSAVIGTAVMVIHVGILLVARYRHPGRVPFVWGAIVFHVWLRFMYVAVVTHALAASSGLALLPAVGLVIVVLATAYLSALALGWIFEKSIELIEAGAAAVAMPLALAPEVSTEGVKKFADFFKNQAWRAAPLKFAKDEATVHAIFLILVSFWPCPAMAAIVGLPVYATGVFGIIAKANGLTDKVEESRKALLWRLYKWSWLGLVAARLVAFLPPVQKFWAGMMGLGNKTLDWGTNAMGGKFENPIPSMEVWQLLVALVVALAVVLTAWLVSKNWGKWGKAASLGPSTAGLLALLVFGTMNAKCGLIQGCGHDDEESAKEATEQKEEKKRQESKDTPPPPPKHTAPPRQAVATPPTPSATAPAKHPSKMSQAELNARLADIAARRKR